MPGKAALAFRIYCSLAGSHKEVSEFDLLSDDKLLASLLEADAHLEADLYSILTAESRRWVRDVILSMSPFAIAEVDVTGKVDFDEFWSFPTDEEAQRFAAGLPATIEKGVRNNIVGFRGALEQPIEQRAIKAGGQISSYLEWHSAVNVQGTPARPTEADLNYGARMCARYNPLDVRTLPADFPTEPLRLQRENFAAFTGALERTAPEDPADYLVTELVKIPWESDTLTWALDKLAGSKLSEEEVAAYAKDLVRTIPRTLLALPESSFECLFDGEIADGLEEFIHWAFPNVAEQDPEPEGDDKEPEGDEEPEGPDREEQDDDDDLEPDDDDDELEPEDEGVVGRDVFQEFPGTSTAIYDRAVAWATKMARKNRTSFYVYTLGGSYIADEAPSNQAVIQTEVDMHGNVVDYMESVVGEVLKRAFSYKTKLGEDATPISIRKLQKRLERQTHFHDVTTAEQRKKMVVIEYTPRKGKHTPKKRKHGGGNYVYPPSKADPYGRYPLSNAKQARNALARAGACDSQSPWMKERGVSCAELKKKVKGAVKSAFPSIEVDEAAIKQYMEAYPEGDTPLELVFPGIKADIATEWANEWQGMGFITTFSVTGEGNGVKISLTTYDPDQIRIAALMLGNYLEPMDGTAGIPSESLLGEFATLDKNQFEISVDMADFRQAGTDPRKFMQSFRGIVADTGVSEDGSYYMIVVDKKSTADRVVGALAELGITVEAVASREAPVVEVEGTRELLQLIADGVFEHLGVPVVIEVDAIGGGICRGFVEPTKALEVFAEALTHLGEGTEALIDKNESVFIVKGLPAWFGEDITEGQTLELQEALAEGSLFAPTKIKPTGELTNPANRAAAAGKAVISKSNGARQGKTPKAVPRGDKGDKAGGKTPTSIPPAASGGPGTSGEAEPSAGYSSAKVGVNGSLFTILGKKKGEKGPQGSGGEPKGPVVKPGVAIKSFEACCPKCSNSVKEEIFRRFAPALVEQDPVAQGGATATTPANDRPGSIEAPPGAAATPSKTEPEEEPEKPTELEPTKKTPDEEKGEPMGGLACPNCGIEIPRDVLKGMLGDLLAQLATQLQQGATEQPPVGGGEPEGEEEEPEEEKPAEEEPPKEPEKEPVQAPAAPAPTPPPPAAAPGAPAAPPRESLGEANDWNPKFHDAETAATLGDQRFEYVPFHELSPSDQRKAIRAYPHKSVGAKYDFRDEHYFYPVKMDGSLAAARAQRVLAIPYKLLNNDNFMAALGYTVNPAWESAASVVDMYYGTLRLTETGMFEVTDEQRIEPVGTGEPGGQIVFSTDVNITGGRAFLGRIVNWFKTRLNRFLRLGKLGKALGQAGKEFGYSIGQMFTGRYVDAEGRTFNEKSLSVEILGVPKRFLIDVGLAIAKEFDQEAVLVRSYVDNKPVFVYAEGIEEAEEVPEDDPVFGELGVDLETEGRIIPAGVRVRVLDSYRGRAKVDVGGRHLEVAAEDVLVYPDGSTTEECLAALGRGESLGEVALRRLAAKSSATRAAVVKEMTVSSKGRYVSMFFPNITACKQARAAVTHLSEKIVESNGTSFHVETKEGLGSRFKAIAERFGGSAAVTSRPLAPVPVREQLDIETDDGDAAQIGDLFQGALTSIKAARDLLVQAQTGDMARAVALLKSMGAKGNIITAIEKVATSIEDKTTEFKDLLVDLDKAHDVFSKAYPNGAAGTPEEEPPPEELPVEPAPPGEEPVPVEPAPPAAGEVPPPAPAPEPMPTESMNKLLGEMRRSRNWNLIRYAVSEADFRTFNNFVRSLSSKTKVKEISELFDAMQEVVEMNQAVEAGIVRDAKFLAKSDMEFPGEIGGATIEGQKTPRVIGGQTILVKGLSFGEDGQLRVNIYEPNEMLVLADDMMTAIESGQLVAE